jgi:hypothetical protein
MVKRSLSRSIALVGVLALLSSALSAQTPKLRPFTVSGIVLDTKGKPLEGATVQLRVDFVYGRAEVTTGADGRYVITDLIRATYRANAYIERPYAGTTACQMLAMPKPTDYNSFPVSQGAERNFRWQLTGKVGNTSSYFGAKIFPTWDIGYEIDNSRPVEFTLTPTGPLLDGSKGSVIVRQVRLESLGVSGLFDLPIGTYKLKAALVGKDGSRTPIKLAAPESQTYQPEIELVWSSENSCGVGKENGLEPFFVKVELPMK